MNNKKIIGIIVSVLIIVLIVVFGLLFSNIKKNNSASDDIQNTDNSLGSSLSLESTETQTTETTSTQLSSVDPENIDEDSFGFENCAFVGNSRLLALGNYDIAPHVFAKVGLTVKTAFKENAEGSSVHVIDELNTGNYSKVLLMFGDNECGWYNLDEFVNYYRDVINAVREKQPNAKIYLLSCLPISQAKSNKNTYGYSMTSINKVNSLIKNLADEEGLVYLDCASSVTGSDGFLPDNYSTDGCHMKKEYNLVWAKYIADNI